MIKTNRSKNALDQLLVLTAKHKEILFRGLTNHRILEILKSRAESSESKDSGQKSDKT